MTPLRVVVTGGSGVLASALRDLRPRWTYLAKSECDVRRIAAVWRTLESLRPDVVLHAAALTDHQHPNAAEVIETNICGTEHVARACRVLGIPLVYVSTHYVYAGATGNYSERSTPRPIGAYAWSKLAGERWVQALLPTTSLVIRGSWYTHETRLRHWAARGALVDAWCSREPVEAAARKLVALVEAKVRGVVNIGGARRNFSSILHDEGYAAHEWRGITRAELNAGSSGYAFPLDTSVDTAKFDALGLRLP